MHHASLNEKLERERGKLERMIREAINSGRPVLVDDNILRQSCEVDLLINKTQEQESLKKKPEGFSRYMLWRRLKNALGIRATNPNALY